MNIKLKNLELKNIESDKNGYTLIEMMIAISIFFIVVTIGTGALVNANLVYKKNRDLRKALDNVNYIMEDISRNLRTGYDYKCLDTDGNVIDPKFNLLNNCKHISLTKIDGSVNIKYKIENGNIHREEGASGEVSLNTEDVKIDDSSRFSISGTTPDDNKQPLVVINLNGKIVIKGQGRDITTEFNLQTAVSQRRIDI